MSDEINPFQWTRKKYLARVTIYLAIWLFVLSGCLFYLKFGNRTDLLSNFETLLGCILIGGIGGSVYCLRAIYLQACVKQEWNENWIVWYLIRPLLSIVVGGVSYLFIKAGLVLFNSSGQSEINQLSIWSLAFLSGLNVDNFIKKIESIGETVWGISPSRTSNNKGTSNE